MLSEAEETPLQQAEMLLKALSGPPGREASRLYPLPSAQDKAKTLKDEHQPLTEHEEQRQPT